MWMWTWQYIMEEVFKLKPELDCKGETVDIYFSSFNSQIYVCFFQSCISLVIEIWNFPLLRLYVCNFKPSLIKEE